MDNIPYEIDDILMQDGRGVHYRAVERSSGEVVDLWRFFPEGIDEARLDGHLKETFLEYVAWMQSLEHGNLVRVHGGGVDELDGVPWLASDIATGMTLATATPLEEKAGILLIQQAMSVASYLEDGAKAMDLAPSHIFVSSFEESDLHFIFTLNPVVLVSGRVSSDVVQDIGRLIEWSMDWQGKVVSSSDERTLQGWVARALSGGWAIKDATESAGHLGGDAVVLMPRQERAAAPVMSGYISEKERSAAQAKKSSGGLVGLASVASIAAVACILWFTWPHLQPESDQTTAEPPAATERKIVAVSASRAPSRSAPQSTALIPERDEQPSEAGGATVADGVRAAFSDHDILNRVQPEVFEMEGEVDLTARERKWTILVGTVHKVRESRSGKTRYIEFDVTTPEGKRGACGLIFVPGLEHPNELTYDYLKSLKGERVALLGKIRFDRPSRRHVIEIKERRSLRKL